MRKLAAVVAIVMSSLYMHGVPPARADFPDRHADELVYATIPLSPGDELTVSFDTTSWNPPVTTFLAVDATDPSGAVTQAAFHVQYSTDELAIEVRADTTQVTALRVSDPRGCCDGYTHQFGFANTTPIGSTGRFAFASWGGTFSVHVSLNGTPVALNAGDPERAFVESPLDFGGGAAVVAGKADAAATSALTRNVDGHLLAAFMPGDAGVGRVTDPSGTQTIVPAMPILDTVFGLFAGGPVGGYGIAQQTQGQWMFALDAEARILSDGSPVLWGVVLP